MEFADHCQHACSRPVPNGYANKIFQANPKERCADCKASNGLSEDEGEDVAKSKKKAKGIRIWNFVSRRKGSSTNTKRPQSMILFGDHLEILEQNRKMSFMEKVRSFKKLRSSGVTKNASKLKASEVQEDLEQKALHRIKKLSDCQRPFRHSYAGYIDDLDCSFEDVELNSCVLDLDALEGKWPRNVGVGVNTEDLSDDCHKMSTQRSVANESENTQESGGAPGDASGKCTVVVHENKKGKGSEIWSYLKGISLTSKDGSKLQDQSVELSNCPDFKNTLVSPPLYLDFETRCEENIGQPRRLSNAAKSSHFGGVLRFFNNVAEAARKWRGSSKSSTQEEPKPNPNFGCCKQEFSPPQKPLVIANENSRCSSSTGVSPDSGLWDSRSMKSLACKEVPQGRVNAEISQEVFSANGSFSETSFSPPSTGLCAFPLSKFPNDCCAFLSVHERAKNLPQVAELRLHEADSQISGTAPVDTWVLSSWGPANVQDLDNVSVHLQGFGTTGVMPEGSTKTEADTSQENPPSLDCEKWCEAGSDPNALCETNTGTWCLSPALENIRAVPSSVADVQDLVTSSDVQDLVTSSDVQDLVTSHRTFCRNSVDLEHLENSSQVSPDIEFTSLDSPDLETQLTDSRILERTLGDSQPLSSRPAYSQDLGRIPAETCDPESSPVERQHINIAASDPQGLDSVPEDVHSTHMSAPFSCPSHDKPELHRENAPIKANGKSVPSKLHPVWKTCKAEHLKHGGVCPPFQMRLCTIVSFDEFDSGKVRLKSTLADSCIDHNVVSVLRPSPHPAAKR
ncbi:hypothetical protein lerEdw1_010312 [Lerista edwardsae]|nr:hypothetical protein lerEdw1_010312 [Lerista edwardsae]